ncbi:MAG: beta-ketoacyl-ACP synthase 3, partial [Myxococcales bacterium]|nr:beta-ketoacyl-ACP synthase 3 [Myxococcales bacterium]
SDLAAEAISEACAAAGIDVEELDAVIVATSTPDTVFPSTACWTQRKLGIRGMAAFDVSAGCTGWLYALEIAGGLLAAGSAKRIAVCGAEVMSRSVDWHDRSTCVLFGDGAGAAVVELGDGTTGYLARNWGADGNLAPVLYQPAGGSQLQASADTVARRLHSVHMEGNAVFRHAVRSMSGAAQQAVADAGIGVDAIDLLIPHQANARIIEATRERVGIDRDRVYSIVDRYGNMSAATVPIAVDHARREGRIHDGDRVLMTAFGTGFTWAAGIVRW